MFGGNSNWRGPVWFPLNYLVIAMLERYHQFYGRDFEIEYPTGSGKRLTLGLIVADLQDRPGSAAAVLLVEDLWAATLASGRRAIPSRRDQ